MLTFDRSLFEAINAGPSTPLFWIDAARWISVTLPVWAGIALLAWAVLGSKEHRWVICKALVAMGATWIGVHLLRWGVPAPRPAQLGVGIQWLDHAARAGFPSMHAAQAFALATCLALGQLPRIATAAFAIATAIAWSRVFLGVHFPLDVLAGATTGLLAAGAVNWAWLGASQSLQSGPLSWQRKFSAYSSHLARPWARRR
ncbi:phosphatase PAP2 family protein [Acidovorax sp. DW039]|uniref:phosphatase PAP2 family protein n=1 Tax=Acidovorax sp. DW039 TaxID=3095606 RepID=UPI003084BFD8|nr:phosphatase PAP2 family protein [Acidovorax sp. DW039]